MKILNYTMMMLVMLSYFSFLSGGVITLILIVGGYFELAFRCFGAAVLSLVVLFIAAAIYDQTEEF